MAFPPKNGDLMMLGFLDHNDRKSTENARLGRSPDPGDLPLMVGWDFRRLASDKYTRLPLMTGGSIIFPDRITFDSTSKIYRFDCNSRLNRDLSLTSFWVRKMDLDDIG